MKFTPCIGRCTYDGTHCQGCGRSHKELADIRRLTIDFVAIAQKWEYENGDEFASSIADTVSRMLVEE